MNKQILKQNKKVRRAKRTRAGLNTEHPRLSLAKSNTSLFLQVIDDKAGKTLVSAHSREIKDAKLKPVAKAEALGKLIGEKALAKNIKDVVFDRGAHRYHGQVKAAADGARAAGLNF